jgi:hypothetical protein
MRGSRDARRSTASSPSIATVGGVSHLKVSGMSGLSGFSGFRIERRVRFGCGYAALCSLVADFFAPDPHRDRRRRRDRRRNCVGRWEIDDDNDHDDEDGMPNTHSIFGASLPTWDR